MTIEMQLQHAVESGEVLRVIYHGGSQPGSTREISPISVSGNKVMARCLRSGEVKSFVVNKLEIINGTSYQGGTEWHAEKVSSQRYDSINSLLESESSRLLELGWHIEHQEDGISLHSLFKNGKPKKGDDVSVSYEEFTYDLVAGPDGELHEENKRKKQRPWSVRGKGKDTKTFGSLDKAAEVFLEWAKLMAPGQI